MIFDTPFETPFDEPSATTAYKTYSLDAIIANLPRIVYDSDALLRADKVLTYRASARIGIDTPSYQADAILVLDPSDPRLSDSYINALMWAFANEWRKAKRAIELLDLRMKLDYANTSDLDDHWGVVLGLHRKSGESDDTYRARLATHIRILTSSGTKANCQAIIDRITGCPNGSEIETFGPAEVVLSWTSPDAIVAAQAQSALIAEAMDRMMAAGVSWSTSYPLTGYNADGLMQGPSIVTYSTDGAISKKRGIQYHMASSMWENGATHYHADVAIQTEHTVSYQMKSEATQDKAISYQIDGNLSAKHAIAYQAGAYAEKWLTSSYSFDGISELTSYKTYSMEGISEKTRHGYYSMSATVVAA